ncbi:hypothetical protein BSLG_007755 [Batrachochytrium salamandrivorans]|nr:hypothetical protein BSLG_007755 [Batrachochytrium salamandrivorans]
MSSDQSPPSLTKPPASTTSPFEQQSVLTRSNCNDSTDQSPAIDMPLESAWTWTGPIAITRKRKQRDVGTDADVHHSMAMTTTTLSSDARFVKYCRLDHDYIQQLMTGSIQPSNISEQHLTMVARVGKIIMRTYTNLVWACVSYHTKIKVELILLFFLKTRSSNARIRHLIKRHAYPQDFDFRVIRGHYIDHRHDTSATCLNEGQNESSDKVEIVNTTSTLPGGACDSDVDLEKLTTSMSLLMVPRVMRVGRKAPATHPAKLT